MEATQFAPAASAAPVISIPMHEDRKTAAHRLAAEKFGKQPDWVVFFREVLGVDGIVRRLFTTPEEMEGFEKSAEFTEIQQMVAKLREKSGPADQGKEPTRVITVRLPQSLHESLKVEAHDRRTSMNQLCISKLLQVIDSELVPVE